MEKTRILYFITALDQGGAQNSVLTTLKRLDKREFEAHLAAGKGGRLDGKVKREFKNLHFIPALRHDVRPSYSNGAFDAQAPPAHCAYQCSQSRYFGAHCGAYFLEKGQSGAYFPRFGFCQRTRSKTF